jgi:hypothetical protein
VLFGALWCSLVLFGALWCSLVRFGALWCSLVLWCSGALLVLFVRWRRWNARARNDTLRDNNSNVRVVLCCECKVAACICLLHTPVFCACTCTILICSMCAKSFILLVLCMTLLKEILQKDMLGMCKDHRSQEGPRVDRRAKGLTNSAEDRQAQ